MAYPGLGAVAQQMGFQGPALSGALSGGGSGGMAGVLSKLKPEQLMLLSGLLSVGQQGQGGGLGLPPPPPIGVPGGGLQGYQFGRQSNQPLSPNLGSGPPGIDEEKARMLMMLMMGGGGGFGRA